MIVELSEERRDFDVPCVGRKSGFFPLSLTASGRALRL